MATWLPTLVLLLTPVFPPLETRFVQVAPAPAKMALAQVTRSPGQGRAVVLIEGLGLHLFKPQRAAQADLRAWQQPGSVLVKAISKDADVFAFTYAQIAPVTDIADLPALGQSIKLLRQAGYAEVVLVGYSAGGVVARQFVEDNPSAGVTKVVQVCTPNNGSSLAKLEAGMGSAQKSFVESLTKKSRTQALGERDNKKIPKDVEFVCVVGNGLVLGDGIVSLKSQWPPDLQAQGVPAVSVVTEHWEALRDERSALVIARLVRESQPRWDAGRVAAMRKRLFRYSGG